MDIFRLNPPEGYTEEEDLILFDYKGFGPSFVDTSEFEFGEIIHNIRSKLWVERYREASEFKLMAPIDSEARTKLPIGSLISHKDTNEVMIVEDHQISENKDKPTEIVITGRGLETILDQRTVGANKDWTDTTTAVAEYILASDYSWFQAEELINHHVLASEQEDLDNEISNLLVIVDTISTTGAATPAARTISKDSVYVKLLELLAIDNCGIKVLRPGAWTWPPSVEDEALRLMIHKGSIAQGVGFSYDAGELKNADYFWTNRKEKNCAYVYGRWVDVFVEDTARLKWNRRIMPVEASDLDSQHSVNPTGGTRTAIRNAMMERGREALAKQKNIVLTKADIIAGITEAKYRTDYNVGDTVSVYGNYDVTASMRVTEFAEIEDETGRSGTPTLDPN